MKKISALLVLLFLHIGGHAQGGIWTWVKGDVSLNSSGHYGTMGVSNSADYPDGRYSAAQWTDLNGNFWILGGLDNSTLNGERNDLWKYDPVSNTWTWINGANVQNGSAIYGTQGIPGPNNIPGALGYGAHSWTDQQGRLWLQGGYTNNLGAMDDLWMYDIPTNQWTWMKGTGTANALANYGTLQVPAPSNSPGARMECNTSWIKADGTFWFFGGISGAGVCNDVWQFDINTNNWTYMSGPQGPNLSSNYGTRNIESPSNLPPARGTYSHWQDCNDNFYIFGGYRSQDYSDSSFNDVWRYNTSNNLWTWISGSNLIDDHGHNSLLCTSSQTAFPHARMENRTAQPPGKSNICWTFGGYGNDTLYNDLWNYNISNARWTRVAGCDTGNSTGSYGVINIPSMTNIPPARSGPCLWVDKSGNLWMWGGDAGGGFVADMWQFIPDTSCIHTTLVSLPLSVQISDTVICLGDTSRITVSNGSIVSISPTTSTSILDSAHIIISPAVPISYILIVTGACPTSDTFRFTIVPTDHLSNFSQQDFCYGDSLVFGRKVITTSGIYTDTFISRYGCDSIVTLAVNVTSPIVHTISQKICYGDSILFDGKITGTAGVYSDTLTNRTGCDSINVLILSQDSPLSIVIDTLVNNNCYGQRDGYIIVKVAGCSNCLFNWSNGSDSSSIYNLSAGFYTVVVTDAGGCADTARYTITEPLQAGLSIMPDDSTILYTDTLAFTSIFGPFAASSIVSYSWTPPQGLSCTDCADPTFTGLSGRYIYSLIVKYNNGCIVSDTVTVIVEGDHRVYVPNAFTPNGDGVDDVYQIFSANSKYFKLSIFDRWGEKVFDSFDGSNGWDGRYREQPEPPDVYAFILDITFVDGYTIHRKGSITLIR